MYLCVSLCIILYFTDCSHEENSPCNTTEQQRRGYATSMRFVYFSAF